MATPKHPRDALPTHLIDSDIDFAGYDPYIVAITGGGSAGIRGDSASVVDQADESRKVKLMTWLREHSNH